MVITGSGLFGATVLIGGRSATDLFYNLAGTALIATTPPGAPGPATVTVEATSGSASITGGFTYLLAPAALAVSPGQGTVTGGTQVTITGIGLSGATSVTFDGAPATIDSDSDTTITVSTPPGAPGSATVVVTTPGGTSNPLTFTYVPLPVPVGISPTQGPSTGGTRATITGSSLSSVTLVTFDGAPATIESSSDTAVTFSTPSGTPGAAAVVVTTAGARRSCPADSPTSTRPP
ncbi:IPT/TIG domain-containing protein [Streptomyces sp. NPDC005526]|uniref:IPT/TIG domain-containing protein n=1 Tax=Streptomyces sp. NPDC005526 TaxID=3156885 RepID=UPI0033AC6E95